MRVWYVANRTGDFRLERHPDDPKHSLLTVEDMTPGEMERVQAFLLTCRQHGWVSSDPYVLTGTNQIVVRAPVVDAGPLLAADALPGRGVLTLVKSMRGTIMSVSDETEKPLLAPDPGPDLDSNTESPPEVEPEKKPDAAVSVRRPTSCCPTPFAVDGPLLRSSRVLREFCTPSQWRSWVSHGFLYCTGHLTGATYRLVHRDHPLAALQGKICRDVTHGETLHFHNCWLPPPEEVLSAKLILENREPWLRHEASYFSRGERFKNPFGNGADGTWDASFFRGLGSLVSDSPF